METRVLRTTKEEEKGLVDSFKPINHLSLKQRILNLENALLVEKMILEEAKRALQHSSFDSSSSSSSPDQTFNYESDAQQLIERENIIKQLENDLIDIKVIAKDLDKMNFNEYESKNFNGLSSTSNDKDFNNETSKTVSMGNHTRSQNRRLSSTNVSKAYDCCQVTFILTLMLVITIILIIVLILIDNK